MGFRTKSGKFPISLKGLRHAPDTVVTNRATEETLAVTNEPSPGKREFAAHSTARVTKASDVLVRDLDGESVVLNLARETYLGLDEVGTRMWYALLSSTSIDAACAILVDEYEVSPAQLREDVLCFVGQLAEAGLIDIHAP